MFANLINILILIKFYLESIWDVYIYNLKRGAPSQFCP